MKVVVTGGAGYVGWSLVRALLVRPDVREVMVLDNFRRANYAVLFSDGTPDFAKLRVCQDDILNSQGLRKSLAGADVVCHLAAVARSPFSHESPHEFDQINHWGTAELCYAVEDLRIPRLVYLSSGAVYGPGHQPFSVQHPAAPVSSYGQSKLAGERQVERLAKQAQTVILRSGTVYGINPCVRFDTALNKFCLQSVLRKALHIHGDGQQRRAVIHVETIARILLHAILGDLATGTYNAVDHNPSILEILEAFQDLSPGLEFMFVNQSQGMSSLILADDPRLAPLRGERQALSPSLARMLQAMGLSTARIPD